MSHDPTTHDTLHTLIASMNIIWKMISPHVFQLEIIVESTINIIGHYMCLPLKL